MEYLGAKQNHNYKRLYTDHLYVDSIVSADKSEDKFWYVLDRGEVLIGCIGNREYGKICEKKELVIQKNFIYITVGQEEKKKAEDIFLENPRIGKIPVLDTDGRLLYEYIRSREAFYDEVQIESGINIDEKRDRELVVSLTSYGKRLDTVYLAIKSIMYQTFKADKILLYIAEEDSEREVVREEELLRAGLVIRRGVKDLKPHKKYFYVMQEFKESIIVTVDDDVLYDDSLLEKLYKKHTEYPDSVICMRGHRMTKTNGKVAPYEFWEGEVVSEMPEKGICATGVGGVLYPFGKYRESFLDEKGICHTALYGDDLWLKAVELIWGVRTYAVGMGAARVIEGSQEDALYRENADNKRNDAYLDSLQQYFNIDFATLF